LSGAARYPTVQAQQNQETIMTAAVQAKPSPTREVNLTRVFDAPRELVFRMWTDPAHMARWWGPHDFTNPVCELDVRVGGAIRIHMRAPDGAVHPMTGTFLEIVPPKRLVFTAVAEDAVGKPLLEAHTVVTLEDDDGRTRLTVAARAVGLAPIAPQMLAGMDAGWSQSLERLAEILRRP
jgi:uncharacterized protein YndB with AHSA1/START domain